MNIKQVLLF